ncbi:MAG TPA: DUF3311 domain-containing protein [Mycobacteriales bacterium]|nr:DUF3311 domain-containing protein [Mycobacteriales bacterium]
MEDAVRFPEDPDAPGGPPAGRTGPGPLAAPGPTASRPARAVRRYLYVLLLLPFAGTLWVSRYARITPRLGGFPFFYWYQLAWVVASALIVAVVYLFTTPRRSAGRGPTPRASRGKHAEPGDGR